MDIADQAEQQESMQREASISAARVFTGTRLQHTGDCHNCGERVLAPKLFCDGRCGKRYELKKGR